MSPSTRLCVLCGHDIGVAYDGEPQLLWQNLFRIVYSHEGEIDVTGVGLIRDPGLAQLVAPLDHGESWSTPGSEVSIGVIGQGAVDGRHGFPFHSACWSMLEEACSPDPVRERRLFDVCRSLPFSTGVGCLTWDHDYGGLISVDHESRPWEDSFIDLYVPSSESEDSSSGLHPFADSSPYIIPAIQQLPKEKRPSLDPPKVLLPSKDIFTKLPLEIVMTIAVHLPAADLFNARLALRSFHPVFHAQQFWASKFKPNSDRSWVFEAKHWPTDSDWLWLYRRTARDSAAINNCKRVWRLAEEVKGLLYLDWVEPVPSVMTDANQNEWREAAADIRLEAYKPDQVFDGGCRLLREISVQLAPSVLSHIAFSLVQPGEITYISGMRFILRDGEVVSVGYMSNKECLCNVGSFTGFNLAVRSRGIQAAQCLLNGGQELTWVGNPDNAPITKRLSLAEATAFKVGFDGYKMVSLSVANNGHDMHEDGLRSLALWYPRVPDIHLHLNESGFTGRETATFRYDPICLTMFGGPRGEYLKFLTGMSVTFGLKSLRSIEFHYDIDDVPTEDRNVGLLPRRGNTTTARFDIDGPRGEVLNGLRLHVRQVPNVGLWYWDPGFLESIKVSTNHGNSCHFSPRMTYATGSVKFVTVVKESTIQGFYWTQHERRLTTLGAASSTVHAENNDGDHGH